MGAKLRLCWHERRLVWLPLVPLHQHLRVSVHASRTLCVHARWHDQVRHLPCLRHLCSMLLMLHFLLLVLRLPRLLLRRRLLLLRRDTMLPSRLQHIGVQLHLRYCR